MFGSCCWFHWPSACHHRRLLKPSFRLDPCVPITAFVSIQFACCTCAAWAHSWKVCGRGIVWLMTVFASAGLRPLLKRRIVPFKSLSHYAVSRRWLKVAISVSRSFPCILMASSLVSASLLLVVSVKAFRYATVNQSQRALSSRWLTGGMGGLLFGVPLTLNMVCSLISLTQLLTFGPFM